MLRKTMIGCAVAVAMLVAPVTVFARSMGGSGVGMHGGHSFGGMHGVSGMHSVGGMHSLSGPRSFGMTHGVASGPRWSHAAFPNHRFAHIRHFRHRHHFPIFAAGIGVGYGYADSCWQWVPGPYGWRWAWVCNYDYY